VRVLFATKDGIHRSQALGEGDVADTARPLTRRALLDEAFRYLDTPYGWGDQGGGRDCSRFVMDVMASFGLMLPRHSGLQALAGSMRVDVSKVKGERDRLALLDAAQERGIVLVHFPGHIMLYLGRTKEGVPMVMHAFAEYLERCAEAKAGDTPAESLRTVDRVQVSDLSLGQGTSRTSFLERVTHLTLLAETPGPALAGVVERRAAAFVGGDDDCPDSGTKSPDSALLIVPERPHPGEAVRVLLSSSRDLGSIEMLVEDPDSKASGPALKRLGGPPFGYWGEIPAPRAGRWSVRIGDGDRVEACATIEVAEEAAERRGSGAHVWFPKKRWSPAMENLYSSFVEQLFAYPFDDRTWPNLQQLLGKRDNNILYNHLGQDEDTTLELEPDCADLPYFLRAYFAWKMRLPFAYRHCNRGFEGKAPYCDRELHDHLVAPEGKSEVRAFAHFANHPLADGVHSGSGRSDPRSDDTDYYPIPLRRETIRPGTVFADPYGHLYVVAAWVPQGVSGAGMLIGADGQPDGTIGRKRFWRGSFLFTPDTRDAGAGFKAFRPTRLRGGRVQALDNDEIAASGMTPFSLEQYQGNKDGFYDRVEGLINPRPLDPEQALGVLIEALHEQAKGRVVSVQNGEDYKQKRSRTIDMPRGHAIFETSGAWEDYATPSRDMRLLIAIDTVLGFRDTVKRQPARFGLGAGPSLDAALGKLDGVLARELGRRTLSYVKSDDSKQELTLAAIVDRKKDFELAYNPNDCVEVRWAAPEGSDERATCKRRAPKNQLERMAQYRRWFAERKRPPR
jgi:hypothetical protein